jgi:hypothetical protein
MTLMLQKQRQRRNKGVVSNEIRLHHEATRCARDEGRQGCWQEHGERHQVPTYVRVSLESVSPARS